MFKKTAKDGTPYIIKIFKQFFLTQITVFFCGNPTLGKMLKGKCDEFGFTFRFHQFNHHITSNNHTFNSTTIIPATIRANTPTTFVFGKEVF